MGLSTKAYLTIDTGGTYLKSAVLSPEGEILDDSDFTTRSWSEGPAEQILQAFEDTIKHGLAVIERIGGSLEGIGITFPGPFIYRKGIPLMEHKFKSIYGMDLGSAFRAMVGPGSLIPVKFVHDAVAWLEGELWIGNAAGFDNAALITLGTGLGFAFSQDGIVQCNEMGGPSLSLYKHPYGEGILEDYASKRGFLRIYRALSGKAEGDIKVSDIGKWANEGDKASIATFRKVGDILAEALKSILDEYQIGCLLFGGQISRSFHHMEEALKQGLADVESLRKITTVRSIDNAAFYGALHKVLNES